MTYATQDSVVERLEERVKRIQREANIAKARQEEALDRARQEAANAIKDQAMEWLRTVVKPEVEAEYTFRAGLTHDAWTRWHPNGYAFTLGSSVAFELIPNGLPEGLVVKLHGEHHGNGFTGLKVYYSSKSPVAVLTAEQTAEQQLDLLAPLALQAIERVQKQRDQEQRIAEAERKAKAHRQRQVAAENLARERAQARIPAEQATLETERAKAIAERGWPEGATLALYRFTWVAAVAGDGVPETYVYYATSDTPGEDGYFVGLRNGNRVQFRIDSPNGYVVEMVTFTSRTDLPDFWMTQLQHFSAEVAEEVSLNAVPEALDNDGLVEFLADEDRGEDHVFYVETIKLEPAKLLHPLIAELVRGQASR